ncbi:hypothetical protein ACV3OC_13005 [Clostridium perfringens]
MIPKNTNYKYIFLKFCKVLIKILPIIISFFVLYTTSLMPSKMKIYPSSKISFTAKNNIFKIILPITFYNSGCYPSSASYISLAMVNLNNTDEAYILTFDKIMDTINAENSIIDAVETNENIFVSPKTSITKKLCFSIDDINKNIYPSAGEYMILVFCWTSPTKEDPNVINSFKVNFSESTRSLMLSDKNTAVVEYISQNNLRVPGKVDSKFIKFYMK